MLNLSQPDLSGALFLFLRKKKKAGTEGGLSCPNKITSTATSSIRVFRK